MPTTSIASDSLFPSFFKPSSETSTRPAPPALTWLQSLSRKYGPALENVAGEIVRFDAVALQQQTAAVAATVGSAVADAATEVDRRFQLGGKLRSLAQQTVAVFSPPDPPRYDDYGGGRVYGPPRPEAVASPAASRGGDSSLQLASPLRRVARVATDAGRRAKAFLPRFGPQQPPPQRPSPRLPKPTLLEQLQAVFLSALPALLVIAYDKRDALADQLALASKVASAAATAAAVEAAANSAAPAAAALADALPT